MPHPQQGTCRSCGAPVYWASTEQGKAMPVDAEPVSDGNVVMVIRGAALIAFVLDEQQQDELPSDRNRYVSHFATCPQAGSWRK